MKHRFARIAVASTAVALLLSLAPAPTAASPVDSKRAEAERLQRAIDANGARISALGEQYNGAQVALDEASSKIQEAEQRQAEAQARVDAITAQVRRRAVALYKSSGASTPLSGLDVEKASDLSARSKYTKAASDRDATLVARLQDLRDELRVEQQNAERERDAAIAQRDAAVNARRQIESANARQQQLLAQVKGEIARILAEEQRSREEAARRAALARVSQAASNRGPATRGTDPATVGGNLPQVPVSGRVAAVIAYARAQLGKPYVFATAGPDTFDCSGLTMMAWRQAGVGMAHFSGAQFNAFPHVAISALQPGDLVFKGPGGRDHVALYIGGGMQIAATHTGDFVRLQPLSSNLSGAVRPG